MSTTARITITSGPDRGKIFDLAAEMVNIGRGEESDVPLSDPALHTYQLSIVNRKGRFAIYTPLDETIAVDGNAIPAERWVWLPEMARIRISDRTSFQFNMNGEEAPPPAGSENAPAAPPARKQQQARPASQRSRKSEKSRSGRNRAEESGDSEITAVARFITDRQGDALVQLGADGQLPELALAEGPHRKPVEQAQKSSGSPLVYIALGISFVMSLLMVLMETDTGGSSARQKTEARREIVEFYGTEGQAIQPYQELLRSAQRAHSRGARGEERTAYHRVLDLLNSEDVVKSFTGLTGDRKRDERLRELVAILLSQ